MTGTRTVGAGRTEVAFVAAAAPPPDATGPDATAAVGSGRGIIGGAGTAIFWVSSLTGAWAALARDDVRFAVAASATGVAWPGPADDPATAAAPATPEAAAPAAPATTTPAASARPSADLSPGPASSAGPAVGAAPSPPEAVMAVSYSATVE